MLGETEEEVNLEDDNLLTNGELEGQCHGQGPEADQPLVMTTAAPVEDDPESQNDATVTLIVSSGAEGKVVLNNNTIGLSQGSRVSSREPSPAPSPCPKCHKTEADANTMVNQLKSNYETEIFRLRKEAESATKTKESVVMKYATSEMEVLKLKKNIENSDKLIKQLNSDMEIANKKQKMLSSERERLSLIIDSKFYEIENLQKEITKLKEELSARDFKVTWTQNKLLEETEAHKNNKQQLETRIEEISKELEIAQQLQSNQESESAKNDEESDSTKNIENEETLSPSSLQTDEIEMLTAKNRTLIEENGSLSCKVQALEEERLDIETKMARLQQSNSKHLHQIASLQSDLAEAECLKLELQKGKELVALLQNECETLRHAHSDILNDMASCQAKEAELLAYTQQVTEKNVALQSEFSTVEAKSYTLRDENARLCKQIQQLEADIKSLEKMMSEESKNQIEEQRSIQNDIVSNKQTIRDLQQELDEARGEIGLLHRKLNSSVRELSKELTFARKQGTHGHSGSDELSQSSRTSSSSSLIVINGDSSVTTNKNNNQEESPTHTDYSDQECPVIPDQQVLVERIVNLQRTLARKQDKLEFLQEHVKQLVDSVQRKSKVIQAYAMSQDVEALSSNLAEQNKAEILKHKGIMASVYGSKAADDAMTLELSLEINRKLQIVFEDTLLRNITLKDSLNTLGKEISKLTEANQELRNQLKQTSK